MNILDISANAHVEPGTHFGFLVREHASEGGHYAVIDIDDGGSNSIAIFIRLNELQQLIAVLHTAQIQLQDAITAAGQQGVIDL
jgi:hypothetical protein